MTIQFINGKAEIKQGRKVLAKIFDKPVFYAAHNIQSGYSFPYSLEISGIGIRECSSLQEVLEQLNKYVKL
jgi:hypothetical protein